MAMETERIKSIMAEIMESWRMESEEMEFENCNLRVCLRRRSLRGKEGR
jgi:hypothetical protein